MPIAWHPTRSWDWCMSEDYKKETEKLGKHVIEKMSSFKFDQKEGAYKDFHKQRQITDLFTIDVNKVVLSDKVPCNNGKDWQYIVGYQVDKETIQVIISCSTCWPLDPIRATWLRASFDYNSSHHQLQYLLAIGPY